MTYVIDASVAVKWFAREHLHANAMQLLDHAPRLRAPDWIILEAAHAAFKKWQDREIASEQAATMVKSLPRFFPKLYSSTGFTDRALAIAMEIRHPVYDCLYVACAEMTGGILITADHELCKAVERTAFAQLVRRLGEGLD